MPLLLATWSFARTACAEDWPALAAGAPGLDVIESVCTAIEEDPAVDSVGYGGLPDRDGAVTLDACVMLGPGRCGSVCAVTRHLHVTALARRVMERTPHRMLVGEGADAFAEDQGFPRADLLAPGAEAAWEAWRRGEQPAARPVDDGAGGGRLFPSGGHDTVCVLALDAAGTLAGAATTSGMPWKQPGRVGDAPIMGHGLYVDPDAGAAAATGSGELVMDLCSSFLAVERMRGGASPREALVEALERVRAAHTIEPHHQVAMIALAPDGATAGVALKSDYASVRSDAGGTHIIGPDVVLMPSG